MDKKTISAIVSIALTAVIALLALFGYQIDIGGNVSEPVPIVAPDLPGSRSLEDTALTSLRIEGTSITFEGDTADDYETVFTVTEPTADRTFTLPDASGAFMSTALATNAADVANSVTGGSNSLIFEGATANAFETFIAPADATADRTLTMADASGTIMLSELATNAPDVANSVVGVSNKLEFEGATADDFESWITPTDPTADRTATLPDASGTVMLSSLATNGADAANAVTGASNAMVWEGSADDFETSLSATDPTADRSVVIPDAAGTVMLSSLATNGADVANAVTGASNSLVFEGATADDFETSLTPTDATADRSVVLPDAGGTVMLSSLATNAADAANAVTGASNALLFEGATADDYELSLAPTDPTADRVATFQDATGTVALTSQATDMTLTPVADGGNEGAKNEYSGLPRIKLVGGAQGTNPGSQTISLVDDSPTGEYAPVDGDVTEAEGSVGSIYKFGASSYHAAFADTAAEDDGFIDAALGANASWEDMESFGIWIYSDTVLSAADLQIVLTDDGGDRKFDIPAVTSANVWTWVEIDISSLAAGTGDVISDVAFTLTATGESNLGAFNVYVDQAWVWDAADEEALGNAIIQDGVLSVVDTEGGASLVEGTDYIVHYESGNDFIVYITDQSTADIVALIAY